MKGIAISAILALLVVLPLPASNMGLALRMQLDSTPQPLHFISLPYHLALPDAGGQEDLVDAEDLCIQVGTELFSVLRWNEATGRFEAYLCGSEFAVPFELEQGVAYGLVNVDGGTIQWQPTHY